MAVRKMLRSDTPTGWLFWNQCIQVAMDEVENLDEREMRRYVSALCQDIGDTLMSRWKIHPREEELP